MHEANWQGRKNDVPVGNFLLTWKSLNSENVKCPVGKFLLPCMVSSDNQKQIIQCCVQSPLIVLSWLLLMFTDFPCSRIKLTRLVNSLLLYLTSWAAMNLARMEHHFHVLLGQGGCAAKWSSVIAWGRGSQSQLRCQMKGIEKVPRSPFTPALPVWLGHSSELGSVRFFIMCRLAKDQVSTEFVQGR